MTGIVDTGMKRRKGLNMKIVSTKDAADQSDEVLKESSVTKQNLTHNQTLRLSYLDFKESLIKEDEIVKENIEEFIKKITKVESLHEQVQRPREQISDAEALLGITHKLCSYLKSYENSEDALLPHFVSGLLDKYKDQDSITWNNIGSDASLIFKRASGISTMYAMDTKLVHRKAVVQKKRSRQNVASCPNEVQETPCETDTEKNVVTMFGVLKKRKSVELEKLVCNRVSFSQTVENIFALSFLVKDGRVAITVDDIGHHFVVPRNAPTAEAIATGDVMYNHFVFRFDYGDWKLMLGRVEVGEEAMPQRKITEDDVASFGTVKQFI